MVRDYSTRKRHERNILSTGLLDLPRRNEAAGIREEHDLQ
jgi:hypothetical protein